MVILLFWETMINNQLEQSECDEHPGKLQLTRMGVGHREQLNPKPCCYPGCTRFYAGTGFSKYCLEHRKREYHKPVKKIRIDNINMCYDHNDIKSTDLELTCSLKGCKNIYKVKILPGVHIYPKYCELHRNAHKREIFLNHTI